MPRVIDSHSHWTPPVLLQALEKRDAAPRIVSKDGSRMIELAPGQFFPLKDDIWNEDVKLEKMNRDRIDLAVVSAVGGIAVVDLLDEREQQPIAREANEQIVALAERHPGRFAGLAVLPMRQPERAVEELEHAAKIGLKGAMVYAHVAGTRVKQVADDHRDAPADSGRDLRQPAGALKLHLSHAGSLLPYVIERIDFQAGLFAQDVAKLSGAPSEYIATLYTDSVCSWVPALRTAVEFFGVEQVMFGTDDPFWPAQPAHETPELSPEDAERVRWRTATELFGLER